MSIIYDIMFDKFTFVPHLFHFKHLNVVYLYLFCKMRAVRKKVYNGERHWNAVAQNISFR